MSFQQLAQWDWSVPELPVDNWWFCAAVLIVLVVSIWAIARLTASATEDIDPAETDRQMLTAVSELRSQGELTTEEFRSIKSRLVNRLSEQTVAADSDDSSHDERQRQEDEGELGQSTETPEGKTISNDDAADGVPESTEETVEKRDQAD